MMTLKVKSGNSNIALEVWGDPSFRRVVLYCHGFPGVNRLLGLRKRLPKGVTLIDVNYRGDKKSGGVFGFRYAIDDVVNAAQYVRVHYKPKSIAAFGYSVGGLYVLNAVRKYPKIFSTLTLLNPLVNTYFLDGAPVMNELWAFTKRTRIIRIVSAQVYRNEVRRLHRSYNPILFAHTIKVPITLIQSEKDEVLPAFEAKAFFDLLRTHKRYIVLAGKRHDCTGSEPAIIRAVRGS